MKEIEYILGNVLKGILKARRKHLISIHLSISSKCKEESLSLSVSRRRRDERTCVLVMCTCIFLFLSKTLGESYRFPSYSRGLRGLSVKPVFAMCKAALLKIRYLSSLSFSLFLPLFFSISVSLFSLLARPFSRPSSLLPSSVCLFFSIFRLSVRVPLRTFRRGGLKIPERNAR